MGQEDFKKCAGSGDPGPRRHGGVHGALGRCEQIDCKKIKGFEKNKISNEGHAGVIAEGSGKKKTQRGGTSFREGVGDRTTCELRSPCQGIGGELERGEEKEKKKVTGPNFFMPNPALGEKDGEGKVGKQPVKKKNANLAQINEKEVLGKKAGGSDAEPRTASLEKDRKTSRAGWGKGGQKRAGERIHG